MDPEQVEATTREVCGFLEETPGVRSSSRLLAFLLYVLIAGVSACSCVYLFVAKEPSASVLGSMAGIITALSGCGAVIQAGETP